MNLFFVSHYLNFDRDEQSQLGKGKGWLNSDKRVKVTYGFTTIQYQIPSMKLKNKDYLIFKKIYFCGFHHEPWHVPSNVHYTYIGKICFKKVILQKIIITIGPIHHVLESRYTLTSLILYFTKIWNFKRTTFSLSVHQRVNHRCSLRRIFRQIYILSKLMLHWLAGSSALLCFWLISSLIDINTVFVPPL